LGPISKEFSSGDRDFGDLKSLLMDFGLIGISGRIWWVSGHIPEISRRISNFSGILRWISMFSSRISEIICHISRIIGIFGIPGWISGILGRILEHSHTGFQKSLALVFPALVGRKMFSIEKKMNSIKRNENPSARPPAPLRFSRN